jgi:YidC/Oxa1 family membrane protein insertase
MSHSNLKEFRNPNQPSSDPNFRKSILLAMMLVLMFFSIRTFLPQNVHVSPQPGTASPVGQHDVETHRESSHPTHGRMALPSLPGFGLTGGIGKYLFLTLQFLHAHVVSNWGWAIVLLTVLINVVLLPLRIRTMQSALKMQRIQPQMNAIRKRYERYKVTDPKRNEMNIEIMKLQKDNGVTMFGGCIPTLIQMPLLIAFYRVLPKVVELRHAHWLWVPDLSAADPYHILPVAFVVSMLLSQLVTPSPGVDQRQQRLMMFVMPIIFGFTTWHYGSGVALYGACSSLIGVIQQIVMNRTDLGQQMRYGNRLVEPGS